VVCFPFVGFLFIRWHLEQNEFGQALELAISKDERQRILTAKEGFPRRAVFPCWILLHFSRIRMTYVSQAKSEQPIWCRCLAWKPQTTEGRKEKFVAAIRNYDWEAAQLLAVGDDERKDLEDSRNRVAWMLHYTADGKYSEALALAITDEEKREIEGK